MSGSTIPSDVRLRVAADFRNRCAYCQAPLMLFPGTETIDHILPRGKSGPDDEANLCLSCARCNRHKAARLTAADPLTKRRVRLFHPRNQR